MINIGLFFGAGAEVSFGLPSGGQFAVDVFRQDVTKLKQELKLQLNNDVNDKLIYATDWLPKDYKTKRIHAFGKNEFGDLIESTIEVNRTKIIDRLEKFDDLFLEALKKSQIDEAVLEKIFLKLTNKNFGVETYSQVVEVNQALKTQGKLFESTYFSALLDLIKHCNTNKNNEVGITLGRYAGAFLQLFIGAHGQELIQRLNQDLFIKAPDDIPIFDDIYGLFKIEYSKAGLLAIELLLEDRQNGIDESINENSSVTDSLNLFIIVFKEMLDILFFNILDYQALIDSHFRYLYSPKKEWAKFTKMVLFLRSAHSLIKDYLPNDRIFNDGYYTDLVYCKNHQMVVNAIGTSNYNNIVEKVLKDNDIELASKIYHLNGSVTDYYNPYKNTVVNCVDSTTVPTDQIYVPFILTQSGLKPFTSVNISRRYVDLFDNFKESDAIVVIGYNFNSDDSHINGLFRELIETNGKKLFWVTLKKNTPDSKRELLTSLRLGLEFKDNVELISVDPLTRKVGDKLWIEKIHGLING